MMILVGGGGPDSGLLDTTGCQSQHNDSTVHSLIYLTDDDTRSTSRCHLGTSSPTSPELYNYVQ